MPIGFQPQELDDIAWKMARGKEYQNAKCEYGSSEDETEYFYVAVPGLGPNYVNVNAGIRNGEMMFRRFVQFLKRMIFQPTEQLISL